MYQSVDAWEDLRLKVNFLSAPSAYPETTSSISTIETHMSWVFLGDEFVYKLKKPVHLKFVDYRTIESRRINANAEVELNKYLAPGVYLGVVPLTLDSKGQMKVGGEIKEAVDWLVKMKRLPSSVFLDQAILLNKVDLALVRLAAERLVGFYKSGAKRTSVSSIDCRLRLFRALAENFNVLKSKKYGLDSGLVIQIERAQMDEYKQLSAEFDRRVEQKRIVEGHGDLRPDHVVLTSPPVIIDRLEFSKKLRTVDALDELSFLSMECDRLGRPDIGRIFLKVYREMTSDAVPDELVRFFKIYRACLRAKLAVWHMDDPQIKDKEKWRRRAENYLKLAASYVE